MAQLDARPTGDQEVCVWFPSSGNTLSWRLVMKYFLWSFPPFHWFKKGSYQFLVKEYAQVLVQSIEEPAQEKVLLGKLTELNMIPMGWQDHKTSTQIFCGYSLEATTYVFVEKYEKCHYFSTGKSVLSGAMSDHLNGNVMCILVWRSETA